MDDKFASATPDNGNNTDHASRPIDPGDQPEPDTMDSSTATAVAASNGTTPLVEELGSPAAEQPTTGTDTTSPNGCAATEVPYEVEGKISEFRVHVDAVARSLLRVDQRPSSPQTPINLPRSQ
ncbi:hypothetical protein [Cyanobium sp. ATX 6F1]|uniref:hypothetical protein n=1 Tax=unclassified Cyanobium TaxID=2627006 RepID=UPI0020CEFDD7|nr:hypothetical protein [Cyanobium sp. ATX 6F1]MCP9917606.1 hypothetical protein [Cyanobium sp. ATX 6F1]